MLKYVFNLKWQNHRHTTNWNPNHALASHWEPKPQPYLLSLVLWNIIDLSQPRSHCHTFEPPLWLHCDLPNPTLICHYDCIMTSLSPPSSQHCLTTTTLSPPLSNHCCLTIDDLVTTMTSHGKSFHFAFFFIWCWNTLLLYSQPSKLVDASRLLEMFSIEFLPTINVSGRVGWTLNK